MAMMNIVLHDLPQGGMELPCSQMDEDGSYIFTKQAILIMQAKWQACIEDFACFLKYSNKILVQNSCYMDIMS